MNIRESTEEDVRHFYGETSAPVALVTLVDGVRLVGIAGVAWCDDGVFAVSVIDKERRNPVSVARLAEAAMRIVRGVEGPVFASVDPDEPTSEKCLRRLGFKHQGGGRYVY